MKGVAAQRVSARTVFGSGVHWLAFGFGAGLAPRAPGTFGTLVAVPFWWLLRMLPWPAFLLVVAAAFAAGCWLCGTSARRLGVHDYGGIVFDEIVGFWLACTPLLPALHWMPDSPLWLTAAFAAFRVFDIGKPWPIGGFDRRVGGGFGIMLDDALAAGYAVIALLALRGFFAHLS